MQLLKDSLFLYLDLKPNENFTNSYLTRTVTTNNVTQIKYHTRLKLKVDDIAGPPPFWTPGNASYSFIVGYFGTFSTLKYQLLLTRYNLNPLDLARPNWVNENGSLARIIAWANGLNAYLKQKDAAKETVYEADGITKMTMGVNAR